MTIKEQFSYIAGFLDADGTITIAQGRKTKNGRIYIPIVCFYNRNLEVLEWIQKIIKLGKIYSKPRKEINHGLCQVLYLRNQPEMYDFLKMVIPFLRIKKKRAKFLWSFLHSRLIRRIKRHDRRPRFRQTLDSTHLPYIKREINLFQKIRQLNQKYCTHAKPID